MASHQLKDNVCACAEQRGKRETAAVNGVAVFEGIDTSYQARIPVTLTSGVTATNTRKSELKEALSRVELDINAFT